MKTEKDISIQVKDLNFNVNEIEILKNIYVNIDKGLFYTIIGPNGSGKTTLLRHLARTLMPDKSTIFLDNKDITNLKGIEFARIVSYIPQEADNDCSFSAMDVVLMGRFPHIKRFEGEKQNDIKTAEWAMKATNTLHLKDKNISTLSGGERQRVIIARALAQQGKILLLDEPTSHLDIHHQIEIMDTLKELNIQYGITILCVLHDLNLAAQYSDFILVMSKGKIEAEGKPEDVITEKILSRVYDARITVLKNPVNDKPYVIPLSNYACNIKDNNLIAVNR